MQRWGGFETRPVAFRFKTVPLSVRLVVHGIGNTIDEPANFPLSFQDFSDAQIALVHVLMETISGAEISERISPTWRMILPATSNRSSWPRLSHCSCTAIAFATWAAAHHSIFDLTNAPRSVSKAPAIARNGMPLGRDHVCSRGRLTCQHQQFVNQTAHRWPCASYHVILQETVFGVVPVISGD